MEPRGRTKGTDGTFSDIYLNYLVGQILAVVSRQSVAKSLIHAFIDEDAHLGACEEQFFRFFKGGNGSFARNRGKTLQEVFQGLSALQVVEQRLDGHARPAKHRRPAENVGVSDNDTHKDILTRGNGLLARRC